MVRPGPPVRPINNVQAKGIQPLPPNFNKVAKKRRVRSGPPIVVGPQIVGGILMMVGAVVWFVLGLLGGIIFFYPPILFIMGILAVFRGAMGKD